MQSGVRTVAVSLAVLLLSCAGYIQFGHENNESSQRGSFRRSLAMLPDNTRGEWKRLHQFISYVDKNLIREIDYLSVLDDSARIDSLVQALYRRMDFKYNPETPDTNEWLGEMRKRMAHCDEHYSGIGVMRGFWDMRAEAVILRGIPSFERQREDAKYTFWDQEWDSDFLTLTYRGRLGENHPSTFVNRSSMEVIRKLYAIERPIYANMPEGERLTMGVQVLTFPATDSMYEFYSISGVDISSLRKETADSVAFHVEMTIYGGKTDPREIARFASPSISLPAELTDRDDVIYPVHVGCKISPGDYSCVVSVFQDSTDNKGVYRVDARIPTPYASSGWSDLLLTVPGLPGTDWNFIKRGERRLVGNISRVFEKGDTLFPYAEIAASPQFRGDSISLTGVLHRIPKIRSSPAIDPVRGGEIVFSESYPVDDDGPFVISHPIEIDQHVKGGDYFLALIAKESDQKVYGLAFTQIKIK